MFTTGRYGKVVSFQFVPDKHEFILSRTTPVGSVTKLLYNKRMGYEFKKITEDVLGGCINGFKISTLGGPPSFDMGIEPAFVFSYLLAHLNPARPDLIRLYECGEKRPLTLDRIVSDTRIDQIPRDSSLRYAIILFYTDEHMSTLVYDIWKPEERLKLFDTMGSEEGHYSYVLPKEVVTPINEGEHIQGSSGCGLLALAFALKLYQSQDINLAIEEAKKVQEIINTSLKSLKLDELKDGLFAAFSLQVTRNVATETKKGKHGDGSFDDVEQEDVLRASSNSLLETPGSIDTPYNSTPPSSTKSFLKREMEKRRKQEQEQSLGV